jgi:hypothetical protein
VVHASFFQQIQPAHGQPPVFSKCLVHWSASLPCTSWPFDNRYCDRIADIRLPPYLEVRYEWTLHHFHYCLSLSFASFFSCWQVAAGIGGI